MTKTAFIVSLIALAATGQASAGGMPASGPQNFSTNDPCLLGTAADQAACAGMIRVAPSMTVQSQTYSTSSDQSSGSQSAMTSTGARTDQMMSMNCVSPSSGANVTCRGHWVPTQQTVTVQPQFQSEPAQVVIRQPPVAQSPIMVPPPATQTFVTPPMMPPVPCCQQQEVTLIPASFFMGGMSYGVGFPTETSYSYGGGGYAFVGGGTRFSGVRARVYLDPPPRKPRTPPHQPCGCH
ncbi:MAG: hypothetical protein RL230_2469 [Pseudomonadota bacterium]|jgi:hypothetical protein